MQHFVRSELSAKTASFLARRQTTVATSVDQRSAIDRLWKLKSNAAFREILNCLKDMCGPRVRCMYCEDNEASAIDHFFPKSLYFDKCFVWGNYLYACTLCNSNFKRDKFPLDASGSALLLDPSTDDPFLHIALSFSTGLYVPLSQKGTSTVEVFGLNRESLARGRLNVILAIVYLCDALCHRLQIGDTHRARDIAATIRGLPFSSVLIEMLHVYSANPNHPDILDKVKEAFRIAPNLTV